jgi:hypothetical protein
VSTKRQMTLEPAAAPRDMADFEQRFVQFFNVPQLFKDPDAVTAEARMHRIRSFLVLGRDGTGNKGYEFAIAGKGPDGKCETWAERFERLYGEKLVRVA